ncbi:MAG: hypothetical protein JXD23_01770 [Spirochaetales bacterium]|nr:hypothetical protein [Spirochaetales bacterium]
MRKLIALFCLLIFLILSSCPSPAAGGFVDNRTLTVTGTTYSWADAANSFSVPNVEGLDPSFTVPGGKGVHKATLTFVTTSGTTPAFTIKAGALAEQALTADGSPTSHNGKNVTLTESPAGTFTLAIELPSPGGTFASSEDWTFGITNLSTANTDNSIAIESSGTSGAALAPDPVYFPYAWSTTGSDTAIAAVKIPGGSVLDDALLFVELKKENSAPNPSFYIKVDSDNQTITLDLSQHDTFPPINNNQGFIYKLSDILSSVSGSTYSHTYMLEIRRDKPSSSEPPPAFNSTVEWILVIQDLTLTVTDNIFLFSAGRNANASNYIGTEAVSTDFVELNQPPRPIILVGGNGTVGGLLPTLNAQNVEGYGLTYSWTVSDGITPEVFSTQQTPAVNPFTLTNYSANGDYEIRCEVTETLATGLIGPISEIKQQENSEVNVNISD